MNDHRAARRGPNNPGGGQKIAKNTNFPKIRLDREKVSVNQASIENEQSAAKKLGFFQCFCQINSMNIKLALMNISSSKFGCSSLAEPKSQPWGAASATFEGPETGMTAPVGGSFFSARVDAQYLQRN
jgi:hypothetical protein